MSALDTSPPPPDGTMQSETDVDVEVHWGCALPGGVVRWDPSYGSGVPVPYIEAEARADVARNPGAKLVRRVETTITTSATTPWEEVQS